MHSIKPTPSMLLVQALRDNELAQLAANRHAAHAFSQALAQQSFEPFVPSVPLTVEDLKARAIQATAESQADKGIDHTLHTCGKCTTIWRSKGFTLCPICAGDVGTILMLDYWQRVDLSEAVFDQKEARYFYTKEGVALPKEHFRRGLDEFRKLLDKYAPWYDRTSRKMIQACHFFLSTTSGMSPKEAIAIHFFEEEWKVAPEEKNTFCPE